MTCMTWPWWWGSLWADTPVSHFRHHRSRWWGMCMMKARIDHLDDGTCKSWWLILSYSNKQQTDSYKNNETTRGSLHNKESVCKAITYLITLPCITLGSYDMIATGGVTPAFRRILEIPEFSYSNNIDNNSWVRPFWLIDNHWENDEKAELAIYSFIGQSPSLFTFWSNHERK